MLGGPQEPTTARLGLDCLIWERVLVILFIPRARVAFVRDGGELF